MMDMDQYLHEAEAQAAALGLEKAFRREFAQIVSFFTEAKDWVSDDRVDAHLQRMVALTQTSLRDATGAVVDDCTGAGTGAGLVTGDGLRVGVERVLIRCDLCLRYWDEGAIHADVIANMEAYIAMKGW